MRPKHLLQSLLLSLLVANALQAQPTDYIGYWPFNGNANDESNNSYDATVLGPTLGSDRFGNLSAYSFDGDDDYISIPGTDQIDLTNECSVFMWVKWDDWTSDSYKGLFHKGSLLFRLDVQDRYSFIIASGQILQYASEKPSGEWEFVGFTYNANEGSNNAKLYINGVLSAQTTLSGEIEDNGNINLGVWSGRNFMGSMDEVLLYNRALTASEVEQLYGFYSLDVEGGSGSGMYESSQTVNISANPPIMGQTFDQWTGEISYVEDPLAPQTIVTMPQQNISLTATYKAASASLWSEIDEENIYFEGNIAIGRTTIPSGYGLAVDGNIRAREVKIDLDTWSDFVFEDHYRLRTLPELDDYILENKHLPDVPSEEQVTKEGVSVGEMNKILLQKIEELTLYIIEQDKQLKEQDKQLQDQNKRIKRLEENKTNN